MDKVSNRRVRTLGGEQSWSKKRTVITVELGVVETQRNAIQRAVYTLPQILAIKRAQFPEL